MPAVLSLPPELLLHIFRMIRHSKPKVYYWHDYQRYIEQKRDLRSFAFVHSTWRYPAKEIQEEEFWALDVRDEDGRHTHETVRLFIETKIRRIKYLTVGDHLQELVTRTSYERWSQVRFLRLLASCDPDYSSWMSHFARFPNLQELYLEAPYNYQNYLCFDRSDSNLQFLKLCRLTLDSTIVLGAVSEEDHTEEKLETLLPITHKLFSPSNMPNLKHLAFTNGYEPRAQLVFAQILPQIDSLAIRDAHINPTTLFQNLDNLRHLSLDIRGVQAMEVFDHDHGGQDLESLHLAARMLEEKKELLPRLIRIAKGEDPKYRIRRIVIYGKSKAIKTKYKGLVNGLASFEWREYQDFEDFDGR